MADKYRRQGGVQGSLVPTESWSAPSNAFDTESVSLTGVSFNNSTATATLTPTGITPDGWFLRVAMETEDTSGTRYQPQVRMQHTGGTGNFVTGVSAGFSRDTSEDRAFISCWAWLDNPGGTPTVQIEWKRANDSPSATDGLVDCYFEAVPFWYSAIGMYTSTTNTDMDGTTTSAISGFSAVRESDTAQIQINGTDSVDLKGDNKRYLALGCMADEGRGGTRTSRIMGFEVDGSWYDISYFYNRNGSNDENGACFTDLIETATATKNVKIAGMAGTYAAYSPGAEANGGSPTSSTHAMVFVELNDSAEVFRTKDATGNQEVALTGPVDLNISRSAAIDFIDAASFARESDTAINCEVAMDALVGANVVAARGSITGALRWTGYAYITEDGVEVDSTKHGNYCRGEIASSGTNGWAANPLGFLELAENANLGVSVKELVGSAGGNGDIETQDMSDDQGITFWGINLDTIKATHTASGTPSTPAVTSSGTAKRNVQASDGSPSLASITAAGTAKVVKAATGAATLAAITAAGIASVTAAPDHTASGTPDIPAITASGAAKVVKAASGTPSITPLESAGVALVHRGASGSPSIPVLVASGSAASTVSASGSPDTPAVEGAGTASKYDKPKTSVRVSFPTPTNNVAPGTDEQKFKAYVRKDAAGGTDPTLRAYLYEDGVQRQDLGTVTVTSETGVLVEWTWTGSNLTNADGSGVECFLEVDTMGTGSNRRTVEYGAIEWCAVWSITASDGNPNVPTSTASGTAAVVKVTSGTPSITPIEASGTAKIARQASDGTPSIPLLEASGTASANVTASGAANIPATESSGAALVLRQASDGSPAVPLLTAAGTAINHRTATDGNPSITPIEVSGTAIVARQASDGGPNVPVPTASGTATKHITASDGAPVIPVPTASGSASTAISATGAPSIPTITSSGTALVHRKASGTVLVPSTEASGTASLTQVASGNGNVPNPVGAGTIQLYRQVSGNGIVPLPVGAGNASLGSDGTISRVVPLDGIYDTDIALDGLYAPDIALAGLFDGEALSGVFDPDSDLDGIFDTDRVVPGKGDPV